MCIFQLSAQVVRLTARADCQPPPDLLTIPYIGEPEPELTDVRAAAVKFEVGQRVDGASFYLFEQSRSALQGDVKNPDLEYLSERHSKTPDGYTTLASRANKYGYLKVNPAPNIVVQKLTERD